MSEETMPQRGVPAQPTWLLQQMEELMASLNADLTALGADLRPPAPPERTTGSDTEEDPRRKGATG
ncbi:hypothetical protein GCM10010129_62120 [Streptomyces fumigatiscleroticus]|nr:hypothetical protein GCM10010129_62120 [Streptomyces fumigatiscleroticus]